jgi:hypothetical protein
MPAPPRDRADDPLDPLLGLPGVADAAAAARTAVDALLAHRVLRRHSPEVAAESLLRGAWASAWLAGARHDLDDVRTGAAAGEPVLQGALRATLALPALAGTWTRAPRQALARMHALAAADLVPAGELGRPRPGAADRLDTLAATLALTSAPAVLVMAVVHGELLALDAVPPVSGAVARAAARLVLITRGLDPTALVALEVGHRELAGDYESALADYRTGTPRGVGRWVVHCADAVGAGARESTAICEAIARG